MCELCDNYDPYSDRPAPPHMWVTYDGRVIDVRTMNRHHAWNLLRWAYRNGINIGVERELLVRDTLGVVAPWETLWFHLRNAAFRVRHPLWRKP